MERRPSPGILWKEDLRQVFYGNKAFSMSAMERRHSSCLLRIEDFFRYSMDIF